MAAGQHIRHETAVADTVHRSGAVAQLVRAGDSQSSGRGFEPHLPHLVVRWVGGMMTPHRHDLWVREKDPSESCGCPAGIARTGTASNH